jgi:hypothetical protein
MTFWRDSELRVPIRWYFTDPKAPFLPFYNRFSSGNWSDVKDRWPGVGEFLGAPRRWVNGFQRPQPLQQGFRGNPFEWANGLLIRNAFGFGGVKCNGSATWAWTHPFPAAGGVLGDGSAEWAISVTWEASGGLVAGGIAEWFAVDEWTTTGGVQCDGSAEWAISVTWTASGGVLGDGEGAYHRYPIDPSGGVLGDGSAIFGTRTPWTASGGVLGDGSPTWS